MSILNSYSEGQKNFGLLMLRIGIGVLFLMHGYPKIMGGPEKWAKLGDSMQYLGIHFLPTMWGFLAAISEFGGAILLMTGILFRPAVALLFITMIVASLSHMKGIYTYDSFMSASHPFKMAIVFFCLIFIGPGNYRLGKIVIE